MAWSATVAAATVVVGIGLVAARSKRERRLADERTAPDERRFGLLSEETGADGLRRIALGQLDLAIEQLRGESQTPPEEAIHETRKALKRLRALMRLLEGELGAKRAKRERAALRDAAAHLAGARDAEVMVSTLDSLLDRHPRKLGGRRGAVELREQLERERRAAGARALGDAAAREQVAAELLAIRARVAKWKLRGDRRAGRLVGPGLARIVRAGRAGRRRAAKRKSGQLALHKWRKHVKDLRYSLEALDVRDSSGKRRSDKRLAKLARDADRLGETLGEEHDLMLLAERVRKHRPLRRRKRTRRLLLRVISRRRAKLRARALRRGKRLYKRGPRRFLRIVRA